jgi:hypothetical protein
MNILKYFTYTHLPEYLQVPSKLFADCVNTLSIKSIDTLINNLSTLQVKDKDEFQVGVFKLNKAKELVDYTEHSIRLILEAKDCVIRSIVK